ncbi:MAG: serine hydrolase [Vulcanimicrobiaceae bacterium]
MKRADFLAAAASAAAAFPLRARAASLEAIVANIIRTVPGIVGVYARTLSDAPPLIALNSEESFPAASTIKVLIMTTAFVLEEQTPGVLDAQIATYRSDLIGGSDFMQNAYDGEIFSVRQLLVPMIQLSDNTAANALIGHFGTDVINSVGRAAGMDRTRLARKFLDYSAIVHHHDNVTTPGDMAHLLFQIEYGAHEEVATIVSSTHCRSMVDIMLGQTDREGIPAGLPRGTPVANKTGAVDYVRNDVAIVRPFGNQPFILSIYTKQLDDYEAGYEAMRAIARAANQRVRGTSV